MTHYRAGMGSEVKAGLRRRALELAPPTPEESELVVSGLAEWLRTLPATLVLVYLSMPGELPAERVVEATSDRHRFATTRTPPGGLLTIHPFDAPRERHRFGYEQPVPGAPVVDPAAVGVVLVPGLAFDRHGNRLGWGKGYYDQLLPTVPSAIKVGVTLERRLVDAIPVEPHDVPVGFLATELGVRSVER
jgi:5-formyltetrahydrofolate cyclo-ligase